MGCGQSSTASSGNKISPAEKPEEKKSTKTQTTTEIKVEPANNDKDKPASQHSSPNHKPDKSPDKSPRPSRVEKLKKEGEKEDSTSSKRRAHKEDTEKVNFCSTSYSKQTFFYFLFLIRVLYVLHGCCRLVLLLQS